MRRSALVLMALAFSLPAVGREVQPPAIVLTDRQGEAVPVRSGCTQIGAGTIEVRQPTPAVLVLTLLGATAATGHPCGSEAVLNFEVSQAFDIVTTTAADRPKLSLEVEAVGLLRGGRIAFAAANGGAAVEAGGTAVVSATLPGREVACGACLAVADRSAADNVSVAPGRYVLHACWRLSATHPMGLLGKAASAEFAPDPALPAVWVGGPRDPFHGAFKKDFGFRATVRVTPSPERAAALEPG